MHLLNWPDPYPTAAQLHGEHYRAGMRQGRVGARPEYSRPRPDARTGPIVAYFVGYDEALAVYNANRGELDEDAPNDEERDERDEDDQPDEDEE